jgi:hypothetical protein
MKKFLIILFAAFAFLSLPVAAFAIDYTNWVANTMANVAKPVWQLAAGLAVIMFIVAGILFITANGEPGKITTAKNAVIWGVVGIIVATVASFIIGIVNSWIAK